MRFNKTEAKILNRLYEAGGFRVKGTGSRVRNAVSNLADRGLVVLVEDYAFLSDRESLIRSYMFDGGCNREAAEFRADEIYPQP